MTDNKDQSAEELRKKIQERLNSMNNEENATKGEKKIVDAPHDTTTVKKEVKKEVISETKESIPPKTEAVKANGNTTAGTASTTTIKKETKETKTPPKTPSKASKTDIDSSIDEELNTTENIKQKSKSSVIFLLVFLLIGVIGLFTWQFLQNNKQVEKNEELKAENTNLKELKADLNQQLQEMLVQYEGVKTSNKELNASLQEEKQKISDLLQQIDKLEDKAAKMQYFRRQVLQLQTSQKNYLNQIDSLATVNKELVTKNEKLTTEMEETQSKNEELSDKVEQASKVSGVGLSIVTFNSKGKENKKNKASKTASLEVSITLVANPLSPKGEKDIYLRIIQPSGAVLTDSKDNIFDFNREEYGYSTVGSVDYQGSEIIKTIEYKVSEELKPGKYDIEVYADNKMIGARSIALTE